MDVLGTVSMPFRKAMATNASDSAFPSKIPTGTEPSADGVITLGENAGSVVQNGVLIVPYATAGDNDTFSLRVIGWRRLGDQVGTLLWIPVVLCEIACTASATVGVAGRLVVATERFVDTITLVTGNEDISIDIVSPAAEEIAHVVTDLKGFQKVEFNFDSTAAGTTGMNCLIAFV